MKELRMRCSIMEETRAIWAEYLSRRLPRRGLASTCILGGARKA